MLNMDDNTQKRPSGQDRQRSHKASVPGGAMHKYAQFRIPGPLRPGVIAKGRAPPALPTSDREMAES